MSNFPAVSYAPRVKIAIYVAAAIALWCAIENYQLETYYVQPDPYKVAEQVARISVAAAALPPNASTLGFITDAGDDTAALALFNASRYAFAPRMLVNDTRQDLVLGNFTKAPDYGALAQDKHLTLIRDFGNGVAVFRGAAQ